MAPRRGSAHLYRAAGCAGARTTVPGSRGPRAGTSAGCLHCRLPWRFAIAWGVVAFVAVAAIEAFGGSLWVSAGVAVVALAAFVAGARWRAARARRTRDVGT